MTTIPYEVSDREVVITRLINAPRELVFKAWTDPKQLAKWWGPHSITNPVCEMDLKPGGKWRIVMRDQNGIEYPLKGIIHEVVPPERLVMTDNWEEHPPEWQEMLKNGLDPGESTPTQEALIVVTFAVEVGQTRLTIVNRFSSAAVRNAMVQMRMNEGWGESLERLEALVAQS